MKRSFNEMMLSSEAAVKVLKTKKKKDESVNDGGIICDLCGKGSFTPDNYLRHVRNHSFCGICQVCKPFD